MRCLGAQCEAGQLLVDVFVNYDCDLEGANLYERLVLALVRLAQGTQDKDTATSAAAAQEEQAIRLSVRPHADEDLVSLPSLSKVSLSAI